MGHLREFVVSLARCILGYAGQPRLRGVLFSPARSCYEVFEIGEVFVLSCVWFHLRDFIL